MRWQRSARTPEPSAQTLTSGLPRVVQAVFDDAAVVSAQASRPAGLALFTR
jgi:hypothetical protein